MILMNRREMKEMLEIFEEMERITEEFFEYVEGVFMNE